MYTLSPTPLERYQALVNEGIVSHDVAQQSALGALDHLYQQLSQSGNKRSSIKGLYLWGKVGRGKTFLMDLFAASLNPDYCIRLHFHHFMASVHQQLREMTGHAAPLKLIARKLSKQYKVLCFDEFFVSDIGDAMLLGNLLQYLFDYKVTLVTTSNSAPESLYSDGLQRDRFMPAIDAILANTHSVHLTGLQDHREHVLPVEQIYQVMPSVTPSASSAHWAQVELLLNKLSLPRINSSSDSLTVLGRSIPFLSRNDGVICFEFSQLCEGPRSHFDYIQLARQFHTVVLLNIPALSGSAYERIKARGTEDGCVGSGTTGEREVVLAPMDDAARRFIALIDELYERKVKLYLTSEVPLNQLYTQGSLTFEFERARSRLIEMASQAYQQRPHQP